MPGAEPGQSPAAYLTTALHLVRSRDVLAGRVDWTTETSEALGELRDRPSYSEARQVLDGVFGDLGDGHGGTISPIEWADELAAADNPSPGGPVPTGRLLAHAVGYINLPGVRAGPATTEASRYARAGVAVIRRLQTAGARSWVVDLRTNPGGDAYPMIAAIYPVLDETTIEGFRAATGPTQWSVVRDDKLTVAGTAEETLPWSRLPRGPTPLVAVLTGPGTVSAGEAVAVAFRHRPRTRSFGTPTAGAATSPTRYRLSDNWVLGFSLAADVDRSGETYAGPITPDTDVPSGPGDPVLTAAVHWLSTQSDS